VHAALLGHLELYILVFLLKQYYSLYHQFPTFTVRGYLRRFWLVSVEIQWEIENKWWWTLVKVAASAIILRCPQTITFAKATHESSQQAFSHGVHGHAKECSLPKFVASKSLEQVVDVPFGADMCTRRGDINVIYQPSKLLLIVGVSWT